MSQLVATGNGKSRRSRMASIRKLRGNSGLEDKRSFMTAAPGASNRRLKDRRMSTTATERFPMFLMPLCDFLKLGEVETFEALHERGVIERFDSKHSGRIIFVSHQWTSFTHPDQSKTQLHTLQSFLVRCAEGLVSRTRPGWGDAKGFGEGATISTSEWRAVATKGFIWMDRMCMPQADPSSLQLAIQSIPSYVERASMFLAVVPPCIHADLGTVCDFSSWNDRGWCRLELMTLMLGRFAPRSGAIVLKGSEVTPELLPPWKAIARPPGLGDLSCCARGHMLDDKTPIPCDKVAIHEILCSLLEGRIKHHLGFSDEIEHARVWLSLSPVVLQNLIPKGQEGTTTMLPWIRSCRWAAHGCIWSTRMPLTGRPRSEPRPCLEIHAVLSCW